MWAIWPNFAAYGVVVDYRLCLQGFPRVLNSKNARANRMSAALIGVILGVRSIAAVISWQTVGNVTSDTQASMNKQVDNNSTIKKPLSEAVQSPAPGQGARVKLHGIGWTGGADVAPRRTDWGLLPDGLADIVQRGGGDITGRGLANGACVLVGASPAPCSSDVPLAQPTLRPVAIRKARAVGVGDDDETKRVHALADWLQATCEHAELEAQGSGMADEIAADLAAGRAEIAADLASEQDTGKRILALAGGPNWGDGIHVVRFNGAGMAARAARYIVNGGRGKFNGRGARPSQTSLDDAGAAAAVAIYTAWGEWASLFGESPEQFDLARHFLCGRGWRAAFASLTRDASEGRTGRKAGQSEHDGGAAAPLDAAQLEVEKKSLEAWARDGQGRMFNPGDDDSAKERRARRRVLSWVRGVLDIRAKGRTGAAERARFSVIARLLHGRDIATAARGAGFANGKQCLESFRTGKVWPRLRGAVAGHTGGYERKVMALRKRAARRAAAAIRAQRAVATGAGAYLIGSPVAASVTLASGTASVDYSPAFKSQTTAARLGAVTVTRPASRRRIATKGLRGAGIGNPLAGEWSAAASARGAAVSEAHAARSLLVSARRERVTLFDNATKGLRAGWMR